MPDERELGGLRCYGWDVELEWLGRPGLLNQGMNGILIATIKPDLDVVLVAAVHDPNLVLRIGVKPLVVQFERRVEQ